MQLGALESEALGVQVIASVREVAGGRTAAEMGATVEAYSSTKVGEALPGFPLLCETSCDTERLAYTVDFEFVQLVPPHPPATADASAADAAAPVADGEANQETGADADEHSDGCAVRRLRTLGPAAPCRLCRLHCCVTASVCRRCTARSGS